MPAPGLVPGFGHAARRPTVALRSHQAANCRLGPGKAAGGSDAELVQDLGHERPLLAEVVALALLAALWPRFLTTVPWLREGSRSWRAALGWSVMRRTRKLLKPCLAMPSQRISGRIGQHAAPLTLDRLGTINLRNEQEGGRTGSKSDQRPARHQATPFGVGQPMHLLLWPQSGGEHTCREIGGLPWPGKGRRRAQI